MSKIDISKIVSEVQGRYAKRKDLASDICSGDGVQLSRDASAYIISPKTDFWEKMIGLPGVPWGKIIQFAGKPDSGKSTTAMNFMEAAQASGATVILWDSEKKFMTSRFEKKMQGDASQLLVSRSKLITEGAKQVSWFVQAVKAQDPNQKILIVWDSVGATLNSSEDDEEDDYSKQPGVSAREVSWAIKKFNRIIEKNRNQKTGEDTVSVICVNQVYAAIGFMAKGDKEKGGQELEFLSSLILRFNRISDLVRVRDGISYKYGISTRVTAKKNHLFDGDDCVSTMDLEVTVILFHFSLLAKRLLKQ
jgi:RecA/RadA recombinase